MENTNYSDDEAEETISLSDYSFASSNIAAEGEDYAGQTILPDQGRCFEFCSEERSNAVVSDECFPAENIIFCGKIITSHEPTSRINLQNLMSIKATRNGKPAAEYSFRWDGSHNTNRRKAKMFMIRKEDQKSRKLSLGKMRWRWSLFLFGGTRRFQTEMALRDIRIRQSRLSPSSTLFNLNNDGDDEKTVSNSTRCQQGLWRLLNGISCGSQQRMLVL